MILSVFYIFNPAFCLVSVSHKPGSNVLQMYYIVEFEQNGEDRAAYGEHLLKKLELRLNTKGLTERRFREFRRLYQVYPQLQSPVAQYIVSHSEIRHTPTAELQNVDIQTENWQMPASKLFNKLPYSHLKFISKIENPVKRSFYEMESMRGCWSAREQRCRHWCSSKQPSYSQKML